MCILTFLLIATPHCLFSCFVVLQQIYLEMVDQLRVFFLFLICQFRLLKTNTRRRPPVDLHRQGKPHVKKYLSHVLSSFMQKRLSIPDVVAHSYHCEAKTRKRVSKRRFAATDRPHTCFQLRLSLVEHTNYRTYFPFHLF